MSSVHFVRYKCIYCQANSLLTHYINYLSFQTNKHKPNKNNKKEHIKFGGFILYLKNEVIGTVCAI